MLLPKDDKQAKNRVAQSSEVWRRLYDCAYNAERIDHHNQAGPALQHTFTGWRVVSLDFDIITPEMGAGDDAHEVLVINLQEPGTGRKVSVFVDRSTRDDNLLNAQIMDYETGAYLL